MNTITFTCRRCNQVKTVRVKPRQTRRWCGCVKTPDDKRKLQSKRHLAYYHRVLKHRADFRKKIHIYNQRQSAKRKLEKMAIKAQLEADVKSVLQDKNN